MSAKRSWQMYCEDTCGDEGHGPVVSGDKVTEITDFPSTVDMVYHRKKMVLSTVIADILWHLLPESEWEAYKSTADEWEKLSMVEMSTYGRTLKFTSYGNRALRLLADYFEKGLMSSFEFPWFLDPKSTSRKKYRQMEIEMGICPKPDDLKKIRKRIDFLHFSIFGENPPPTMCTALILHKAEAAFGVWNPAKERFCDMSGSSWLRTNNDHDYVHVDMTDMLVVLEKLGKIDQSDKRAGKQPPPLFACFVLWKRN